MENDFLQSKIEDALSALSLSIEEEGPFETANHLNHFIRGICSNPEQLNNICWVILGFYARICKARFEIISTLDGTNGTGKLLCENIRSTLHQESEISPSAEFVDQSKIIKNRDPLLYELIIHALMYAINRKKVPNFLTYELNDIRAPHTKVYTQGIDLIGIASENGQFFPFIGEMKAYENDPQKGFIDACEMFISINNGSHNTEIKTVYENCDEFSREDLANNIWLGNSIFSAFIGHEETKKISPTYLSKAEKVKNINCYALVNCATPFTDMRKMFENIVTTLYSCLSEYEAQYD